MKKPSPFRSGLKAFGSLLFGLLLAALVFMALPFLQMVADMKKKEYVVQEVLTSQDEPPPPELEQPEPEEPEPEETPPPPAPENISFDQLAGSFDLGGGTGNAPFVQNALADSLSQRAGNAISLGGAVKEPKPIKRYPPKKPQSLKGKSFSGTVKVAFVVDSSGRVTNPRLVSSVPDPRLAQPILVAVKKWRFEPGTRDGVKCPFKVVLPISLS